jgi:cell division protease FtsH
LFWVAGRFLKRVSKGLNDPEKMTEGLYKIIEPHEIIKGFDDLIGMTEVKQQLTDLLAPLTHPQFYEAVQAKPLKSLLLFGPPGTGKTTLAKAIAKLTESTLVHVGGSDIDYVYRGSSALRVRALGERVEALANEGKNVVLFIDEIDAVGSSREGTRSSGTGTEALTTLLTLLAEINEHPKFKNVKVVLATNFPDRLDEALTREGRIDTKLEVPNPTIAEIKELLTHFLNDKPTNNLNIDQLATKLKGFSPATIQAIIEQAGKEAGKVAQQANSTDNIAISNANFQEALETKILGIRKLFNLSPEEKLSMIRHELGHMLLGLLENPNRDSHLSFEPRGEALAVAFNFDNDPFDKASITRQELIGRIRQLQAGRAAEQYHYGLDGSSTGAGDDFKKVTHIITSLIQENALGEGMPQMAQGRTNPLTGLWESVWMGANQDRHNQQQMVQIAKDSYNYALTAIHLNQDLLTALEAIAVDQLTLDSETIAKAVEQHPLIHPSPEAITDYIKRLSTSTQPPATA